MVSQIWTPDDSLRDSSDDDLDLIKAEEDDVAKPETQKLRRECWRKVLPLKKQIERIIEYGPTHPSDARLFKVMAQLCLLEIRSKEKGL